MRIALDMDSVLADILPVTAQVINEKLGTNLTTVETEQWMFLEKLGLKGVTYPEIFEETWKRWEQIKPMEHGLAQFSRELMGLGEVDIVTAAGGYKSEEARVKWLQKYDVMYHDIVVVPMHGKSASGLTSKLELPYDIWIDDNPEDTKAALSSDKRFLVYDRKHNRDIDTSKSPNVTRIRTLRTAVAIITAMSKHAKQV